MKQTDKNAASGMRKRDVLTKEKDKVTPKESKQKMKLKDRDVSEDLEKDISKKDQVNMKGNEMCSQPKKNGDDDDKTDPLGGKIALSITKKEQGQIEAYKKATVPETIVLPEQKH